MAARVPRTGLAPVTFDDGMDGAIARVTDAFKAEGFGALTQIDVAGVLREKVGAQIAPYTILGMCNPLFALRAIDADPEVGRFLPCNVLLRQTGDTVTVQAQDPVLLMGLTGKEELALLAEEARELIERALQRLRAA